MIVPSESAALRTAAFRFFARNFPRDCPENDIKKIS
jgi:hypothetical protein